MTAKIATLANARKDSAKYVFVVVKEPVHTSAVQKALDREWEHFGRILGENGWAYRAGQLSHDVLIEEFLAKEWPDVLRRRIDEAVEPLILVIEHSFNDFDPNRHAWAILWLSALYRSRQMLGWLFTRLEQSLGKGENLIAYLKSKQRTPDAEFRDGSISTADDFSETPRPRKGGRLPITTIMPDWREIATAYRADKKRETSREVSKRQVAKHLEAISNQRGKSLSHKSFEALLRKEKFPDIRAD